MPLLLFVAISRYLEKHVEINYGNIHITCASSPSPFCLRLSLSSPLFLIFWTSKQSLTHKTVHPGVRCNSRRPPVPSLLGSRPSFVRPSFSSLFRGATVLVTVERSNAAPRDLPFHLAKDYIARDSRWSKVVSFHEKKANIGFSSAVLDLAVVLAPLGHCAIHKCSTIPLSSPDTRPASPTRHPLSHTGKTTYLDRIQVCFEQDIDLRRSLFSVATLEVTYWSHAKSHSASPPSAMARQYTTGLRFGEMMLKFLHW